MKKMVMNHESRYLFKNKIILMVLALYGQRRERARSLFLPCIVITR